MIKFLVLFIIGFGIWSCKGDPSSQKAPEGVTCQCGKREKPAQPLNALSIKEAQNLCNAKGEEYSLKHCAKNK